MGSTITQGYEVDSPEGPLTLTDRGTERSYNVKFLNQTGLTAAPEVRAIGNRFYLERANILRGRGFENQRHPKLVRWSSDSYQLLLLHVDDLDFPDGLSIPGLTFARGSEAFSSGGRRCKPIVQLGTPDSKTRVMLHALPVGAKVVMEDPQGRLMTCVVDEKGMTIHPSTKTDVIKAVEAFALRILLKKRLEDSELMRWSEQVLQALGEEQRMERLRTYQWPEEK